MTPNPSTVTRTPNLSTVTMTPNLSILCLFTFVHFSINIMFTNLQTHFFIKTSEFDVTMRLGLLANKLGFYPIVENMKIAHQCPPR